MATYSIGAGERLAAEKTLVASTVDTVNITRKGVGKVRVHSDGAASIFIRVDGTAPTVGAAASYYIPAVAGAFVDIPFPSDSAAGSVKLISVGTPKYSVEAL
jgi:hypothetical protein